MNNGKLVSVKMVADRLLRNPLMKELNWEFIVDNAVECMRLVGAPSLYISRKETVEIKNFKGDIPLDLMQVESVLCVRGNNLIPMRGSEDTLHNHYDQFKSSSESRFDLNTYSLNNSKIFTSFENGKVVFVYKAIATDSECYPMILDSPQLLRAIESYIKYKWFDILNDMDKISDRKLNKAETDYCFNVAQAQSNLQMPSIDEMESLVNSITQILPSRLQHADRFKHLGSQEFMRIN